MSICESIASVFLKDLKTAIKWSKDDRLKYSNTVYVTLRLYKSMESLSVDAKKFRFESSMGNIGDLWPTIEIGRYEPEVGNELIAFTSRLSSSMVAQDPEWLEELLESTCRRLARQVLFHLSDTCKGYVSREAQ